MISHESGHLEVAMDDVNIMQVLESLCNVVQNLQELQEAVPVLDIEVLSDNAGGKAWRPYHAEIGAWGCTNRKAGV